MAELAKSMKDAKISPLEAFNTQFGACSTPVVYLHGMEEKGVRFPSGPQIDNTAHFFTLMVLLGQEFLMATDLLAPLHSIVDLVFPIEV